MPFKDILGQGPAIRTLKKIIESEKMGSTYLFLGPEGVGKKKAAITLAEALNCEKKEADSCGECQSCRAIERGAYGEVILLEPKGPIQTHHIDTIREMQGFVNLRSFYGKWKVVIIDEADRITEEAAASLLKILEEPPLKTLFILVSSRPENIFETILSRCHPIRFLPLTRDVQRKILEGHLKTKAMDELLSISIGGLKKAMEFSTPEREAWRKEIFDWDALSEDIFFFSQKIANDRKQDFIMDTLHLLFTWFRDILFIKQELKGILNKDYEDRLTAQAGKLSFQSLWTNLQAIIHAQRDIQHQVNPRLVLDTLFLTLAKNYRR